jgi:pyrroloquinoline-quinone synthase
MTTTSDLKMNTQAEFWKGMEARIARFDLLQHPFYQAWSKGELTRAELREYAAEYWHHVSAFPTYLSALHAGMGDGEERREVLRNLAEEEGVDAPLGRPHSDLWMDFAVGMGASRSEVAGRAVQPETTALVAAFRELMREKPVVAMAALYAYESRVPGIAQTKAEGLAAYYGVATSEAAARYFTLHETADVHHAAVWRELMNAQLAQEPEAAEAALAAGERAAQALWMALDGIERERLKARSN